MPLHPQHHKNVRKFLERSSPYSKMTSVQNLCPIYCPILVLALVLQRHPAPIVKNIIELKKMQ